MRQPLISTPALPAKSFSIATNSRRSKIAA
jgi:hypothetical protein